MDILLFLTSSFHYNQIYVNEGVFCEAPKNEDWLLAKPTMNGRLELLVPPSDSEDGRGAGGPISYQWQINQSCLHKEASIEKQKEGFQGVSTLGSQCLDPSSTRTEAPLFRTRPYVSPCGCGFVFFNILCNKLVICGPSSHLIEPREEVKGISML